MMKKLRVAAACFCCLAAFTTTVTAQMGMGMRPSMPMGIFTPTVGSGAQYESTAADGTKSTIEFAVVGKEAVNGADAYWLEWSTTSGKMGEMVMKTLIAPESGSGAPTRMIMQMGGRNPMEMPAQMSHMGNQPAPKLDIRSSSTDLGKESVTTPAGTFSCEHYRANDGSGDAWVSSQAPPFGMVKSQSKSSSMVLTKLVTDAHTKIVGTPVPFNPQLMMQGQPPAQ
jgi:hypothetical protein